MSFLVSIPLQSVLSFLLLQPPLRLPLSRFPGRDLSVVLLNVPRTLGERQKLGSGLNPKRKIVQKHNPSPRSDLATKPQRGQPRTASFVICFQFVIKKKGENCFGGAEKKKLKGLQPIYKQMKEVAAGRERDERKGLFLQSKSCSRCYEMMIGGISHADWGRGKDSTLEEVASTQWDCKLECVCVCVCAYTDQRPRLSWICLEWGWKGLRGLRGQPDGTRRPLGVSKCLSN